MLFPRHLSSALSCERDPVADDRVALGGHLPALDVVRGLAILVVTAYRFHGADSDGSSLDAAVAKVISLSDRGVDLFFVLSGFLITGILAETKTRPHFFRNFYIRRGLRIFPLYVGVLIVAILILPLWLAGTNSVFAQRPENEAWLWLHASNLLMTWEGRWLFPGFEHFWSLAVEEHFYLVWPVVIWCTSRRTAMWICGGCILVAAAFRGGFAAAGLGNPAADVFTLCRFDALAAGAWLALYLRGPHSASRLAIQAPWIVAIGCGMTALTLAGRKLLGGFAPALGEVVAYSSYTWTAFACLGILLIALTTPAKTLRGRFWNHPWLQSAGKYSYGWYVFQGLLKPDFMLLGIAGMVTAVTGWSLAGRGVQIIIGGGISLAAAVVSWYCFEKRFLALKDYLAPSSSAARP